NTEIRASSAGTNCPSTYTCILSPSLRKVPIATRRTVLMGWSQRSVRLCAAALAATWDTATLVHHAQTGHAVAAVAYGCAVRLRPRPRRVRAVDSILAQPGNRYQASRSRGSRQIPAEQ